MPEEKSGNHPKVAATKNTAEDFTKQIGSKAARKLKAKGNTSVGVWFGLGMMGLIGWSIVVPTLLGAAIGLSLDKHYPGGHSWTLALLMAGLTLGCFNAWHWVDKEAQTLREEQGSDEPSKKEQSKKEQSKKEQSKKENKHDERQ